MKKVLLVSMVWISMAAAVIAQPTVDGADSGAEGYNLLATNTLHGFGGTNNTMWTLSQYNDGTDLYIFIELNSSNNNACALFLDVDTQTGVGSTIPASGPGMIGSMSGDITPLSDLDYGMVFNSGDDQSGTDEGGNDASCYVDWINYAGAAGSRASAYLGTEVVNDSNTETSQLVDATGGIIVAYSDGNTDGSGNEGCEIKIPLTAIGASSSDSVSLWAAFGSGGGWMASDNLPPLGSAPAGTNAPNIGNAHPINFATGSDNGGGTTWTAGSATSTITLPVELSAFGIE